MGYEVDLIYADYTAQWVSIASGDLHIAMEQWQESTIPQMEKFLSEYGGNGEIAFLGDTGVIGETGYYVPTYVIEGDPERGIEALCPQLKDWNQLNECASVFATLETAPKGRWLGCPSVGWGCEDEKRVKNLGLDFVSVAIGSEAAHWAEIEGAYSRGEGSSSTAGLRTGAMPSTISLAWISRTPPLNAGAWWKEWSPLMPATSFGARSRTTSPTPRS